MSHAEIDPTAKGSDRLFRIVVIEPPAPLADHRDMDAGPAEWTAFHLVGPQPGEKIGDAPA
ncbi:MAG: hypothetical protein ACRD2A_25655, partial [Vicinamibacterales bacterium]